MNILLLGSNSQPRKLLLDNAKIPYQILGHTADEELVDQSLDLQERVAAIARHKMEHVSLPAGKEGQIIFVLTADSMGKSASGKVYGKPKSRQEAVTILESLGVQEHSTATGFCLDKKQYHNGAWQVIERVEKVVTARYQFEIPQHWIDRYLEHSWGLNASSAIAIEGYGEQFLKTITGSYTAVIGLPMFELRQALEQVDF